MRKHTPRHSSNSHRTVAANHSICYWCWRGRPDPCRSSDHSGPHWVCVCACARGQSSFDLSQASYGFNWLGNNYIPGEKMMEGEVKECSKNRRFEEKYAKKHQPILHEWLFLSVLWHFSNASHENVSYLLLLWFLFTSPGLHFLSNSHSDT